MSDDEDPIRDILSKVLLDGQNQIHDLKDGKATPEEITERMFASLDYWTPKANRHYYQKFLEMLPEKDKHSHPTRNYCLDCAKRDGYNKSIREMEAKLKLLAVEDNNNHTRV